MPAMIRLALAVAACVVTPAAASALLLLAPSAESLTVECRSDGLYLAYQLDDLPSCSDYSCTTIKARTGGSEWTNYSAHDARHSGFVRNQRSKIRRNGALAEQLLERMLDAKRVEFLNPGTGEAVAFPIGDEDREGLQDIASECGKQLFATTDGVVVTAKPAAMSPAAASPSPRAPGTIRRLSAAGVRL